MHLESRWRSFSLERVNGRIYQKSKEKLLKRGMNWEEKNEESSYNLSAV
nr:MAG TPA: protein of unknown function (DUF5013) [Caudoviricetes sp.]